MNSESIVQISTYWHFNCWITLKLGDICLCDKHHPREVDVTPEGQARELYI